MKRLRIAMIALFALTAISNVNAQNENLPWTVGLSANVVDFYDGSSLTNQFKDLLGNGDWNLFIPRISIEKYHNESFSFQLAGTINQIKTLKSVDDSDFGYFSIDAIAKYDVNKIIGQTKWFDPYLFAGVGYTRVNSKGDIMPSIGFGFNTWFNETLGLNFQTGTKAGFAGKVEAHYQTSLGLVYRFGGVDTDDDGINDKDDACPEVAGLAEFNGCPDTDGDGVKDSDDACPGVAGLASLNGCPDSDGDEIADKDDMCPNSKGTKANKGCPDSDADGIVDKDDKCPTVAGAAANNGCPFKDSDNDGVLDKDDKCPSISGVASNNGCPEAALPADVAQMIMMKSKSILFNLGRASFKPGVIKQLDAITEIMKQYPKSTFLLEGHTDTTGPDTLNERLSIQRANTVKNYLVKKGINAERLSTKGFADKMPTASNNTREGRAKNRRVEIRGTN